MDESADISKSSLTAISSDSLINASTIAASASASDTINIPPTLSVSTPRSVTFAAELDDIPDELVSEMKFEDFVKLNATQLNNLEKVF